MVTKIGGFKSGKPFLRQMAAETFSDNFDLISFDC